MRILAVTGAPGAGKTSSLGDFAVEMARRNVSVGGVIQRCRPLSSGGRAYFAERPGRRDFALVAVVEGEGRKPTFFQEGFAWAARRILAPSDVCLIDEMGWLEAEGRGHWPALRRLLRNGSTRVILVSVRQELLELFMERLAFQDVWRVYRGKTAPVERWAEVVLGLLKQRIVEPSD